MEIVTLPYKYNDSAFFLVFPTPTASTLSCLACWQAYLLPSRFLNVRRSIITSQFNWFYYFCLKVPKHYGTSNNAKITPCSYAKLHTGRTIKESWGSNIMRAHIQSKPKPYSSILHTANLTIISTFVIGCLEPLFVLNQIRIHSLLWSHDWINIWNEGLNMKLRICCWSTCQQEVTRQCCYINNENSLMLLCI